MKEERELRSILTEEEATFKKSVLVVSPTGVGVAKTAGSWRKASGHPFCRRLNGQTLSPQRMRRLPESALPHGVVGISTVYTTQVREKWRHFERLLVPGRGECNRL
jgi:hypothetical protein